jgi:hypothetical protein
MQSKKYSAASAVLLALLVTLLTACSSSSISPNAGAAASGAGSLKAHVADRSAELGRAAAALRTAAGSYLELARAADFDYAALAKDKQDDARKVLLEARQAFRNASTSYGFMEAIVAGAPALADFDLILDTGTSESEGDESVVPFDLKLPDGRVLAKPGNLFGVLESTLWGTRAEFRAPGDVVFELDGDPASAFGDALPDANVLSGAADVLVEQSAQLEKAVAAWQPSDKDAYIALLIMLPSLGDYIAAWKESRFVLGEASLRTDYVAVSRIADLDNVLKGVKLAYSAVEPQIQSIDAAAASSLRGELDALAAEIAQTAKAEAGGRRFSSLEAGALADKATQSGQRMADVIFAITEKSGIKIED